MVLVNYVFLKKNTGLVLFNSVSGAVENIQDDNFSETMSIATSKDELLLLKPDGLYTIKIKNLLAKKYQTEQLLKLKEGAYMQFSVARDNLLIADNNLGLLRYRADENFSALDTFKLVRPNGSTFTKIISDRFSNIYVSTT
ncbi:MAG: hypothetical protein ACXVO9_03415, partial [Bacteroidia bacterium]